MKGFGILFCIVGVVVVAVGVPIYFADREGAGIACMVLGSGFFVIGVMMFLTEFVLQLARRNANVLIRARFFKIELVVQGELRSPEDELEGVEVSRGHLGEAGGSTEK